MSGHFPAGSFEVVTLPLTKKVHCSLCENGTTDEFCQCGRWHWPAADWDVSAGSYPVSLYSALPDHMPERLGGCTQMNHGVPPHLRRMKEKK